MKSTKQPRKNPTASPTTRSKKVGSSGSKSKIPPTSKTFELAVGHEPGVDLTPQDESLFRAFQSNLLSLISHELRTPLMGVMNALTMIDEGESGLSQAELVSMARQNAQRLNRALNSLLDLAQLESGSFQARLREVDLGRLIQSRVAVQAALFRDSGVSATVDAATTGPSLADAHKMGRGIDHCFHAILGRMEKGSALQIRISSTLVLLTFNLTSGMEELWQGAWSQALTGIEAGVISPGSAFAGVMQSEQAFLTRAEEGLGSEFLIIHEVMRLHGGQFSESRRGREVQLKLEFPDRTPDEALHAVLASRSYDVSSELGSVALVLVQVPANETLESFIARVQKTLFRSTDVVYRLPASKQLAIVLDDCKPADAPQLLGRIERTLGIALKWGAAHCPADGLEPEALVELAQTRLKQRGKST